MRFAHIAREWGTVLAAAILVAGLGATAWQRAEVRSASVTAAERADEARAHSILVELGRRLSAIEAAGFAAQAVAAVHGNPDPAQWRAFIGGLDPARRFPGLQGVSFIRRIEATDLDALVAADRARDSRFVLQDRAQPDPHCNLVQSEPRRRNAPVAGRDACIHPTVLPALQASIASGSPAVSGPFTPGQISPGETAVLLNFPVFPGNVVPPAEAARRETIIGWVSLAVVMGQLIQDIVPKEKPIRVAISDDEHGPLTPPAVETGDVAATGGDRPAAAHSEIMRFGGRDWRATVELLPPVPAEPWMVDAFGIVLSTLLSALVCLLGRTRRRALALAERLGRSLSATDIQLADAVESLDIGVALFGPDGRLVRCNSQFLPSLPERRGLAGLPAGELFDRYAALGFLGGGEGDLAALRHALMELFARADGTPLDRQASSGRWFRYACHRMSDGGTVVTIANITALKQSEMRLWQAIESIPDAFALFDAHGKLTMHNARFRDAYASFRDAGELIGRSFGELAGIAMQDMVDPTIADDAEHWPDERVGEHGLPTHHSYERRLTDGRTLWISRKPTPDGGTVLVASDISALKRAKSSLRDAIESIDAGFGLFDAHGKLVLHNDKFAPSIRRVMGPIVGLHFEQIIERRHRAAQSTRATTADDPIGEAMLQSFRSQRRGAVEFEGFNGRWYRHVTTPARHGRTVVTITDISDLKQHQAEIEAASAAKSEFLAVMSHEIRTPMNGVIGMLGLAEAMSANPEQAGYLSLARRSADGLMAIIDDILDISKLEAGRIELETVDFHLEQVVDAVVSLLSARARARQNELSTEVEPEVSTWFRGDPTRLRQILFNLVGNAIKFTEKGAIRIRVGRDAGRVRFEVVDTGVGIAPEAQAKIFDRFVQADTSTTRRYGGTGLGLSICKQLVALMDGEIGVESEPRKGSRFWFVLPLPEGDGTLAEDATEGGTAGEAVGLRPLRVLVAEDNQINQLLVRKLLERAGHTVELANDGAEAVDAARRGAFDVILMDVQMPVMDGLTATRQIREMGGSAARTPIIALTANALVGDRERYLASGMNDHVPKPIDAARLFAAMADAIGEENNATPDAAARIGGPIPVLDRGRLDEIRNVLDRRAFNELLASLMPSLTSAVAAVVAANASRDVKALVATAHTLKGMAGNFGVMRLADIAERIERCDRGEDAQATLVRELGDAIRDVTRALEGLVAEAA